MATAGPGNLAACRQKSLQHLSLPSTCSPRAEMDLSQISTAIFCGDSSSSQLCVECDFAETGRRQTFCEDSFAEKGTCQAMSGIPYLAGGTKRQPIKKNLSSTFSRKGRGCCQRVSKLTLGPYSRGHEVKMLAVPV